MKYIVTFERVDYFDIEVIDAGDADEAVAMAEEIILSAQDADIFLMSRSGFEIGNIEPQKERAA